MSDDAGYLRSIRAVVLGAAAIVSGSLAMTTILGVAAIAGMLVRGSGAETIVAQLPSSLLFAIFCAAGGLIMCVIGGYSAAMIAGCNPIRHALCAGALATPLSLAVLAILGDSGPVWLTALATALMIPCATVGGWFATPVAITLAAPVHQR
jgi:hypothetical protein